MSYSDLPGSPPSAHRGQESLVSKVNRLLRRERSGEPLPSDQESESRPSRSEDFLSGLALAILLIGIVFLAMIPADLVTQTIFVLSIYVGLSIASLWRDRRLAQYIFLILVTLISLRYFIWRSTETLSISDPISTILMFLLYFAELFGFVLFILSLIVNIKPKYRKVEDAPVSFDNLPTVDIFVPTYNEDVELVAVTLSAATQVDYPKNKLSVYLLDDGGTDNKLSKGTQEEREKTRKRAATLKALCERLGARYLTRPDNDHAKSGNLNHALTKSDGDLVLILDADHIPASDILWRTVGYFQRDPGLGLVQTPHFMANPDPVEKNLDMFQSMPSENEMFFRHIQCGLDFWGASFFCGSAGLINRKALEEIGGFGTTTVTEDAETSIDMHSKGWRSVYIDRPMVSGLSPETLSGFIQQRVRWAQGMIQIFLLKNPLVQPGLSFGQRIGYLSSCLYWFFPFARAMFLLAPLAYLLFGRHIYDVSGIEFLAYTLPHFLATMIFSNAMFQHVRWPFVSAIYELTQSIFALRPIVSTLRHPHKPRFNVTPKREHLEQDFISPLALPFYALLILIFIGFIAAGVRWGMVPEERDVILITTLWNGLNLIALLSVFGILLERRQLRSTPRLPTSLNATVHIGDQAIAGEIIDLSIGGACFIPFDQRVIETINLKEKAHLVTARAAGDRRFSLRVKRISLRGGPQPDELGLSFATPNLKTMNEIVSLVHGDSAFMDDYWRNRPEANDALDAITFLVWSGLQGALSHGWLLIKAILRSVWELITSPFRRQTRPVAAASGR